MHSEHTPVLVVGGGPAGLAVAGTLGRYGIETLVLEARHERSPLPRATVISTRTMELLRSWGLEQEVLAGGADVDLWLLECATLAQAADGVPHAVGYPTRQQAAVVSPTAPAAVPQDHLELVLDRHVRRLPTVRVERGSRLVSIDDGPDRLLATVQDASGRVRTVRADHLVAADGARSEVRRAVGIPMRGSGESFAGAQVIFRAPIWPMLPAERYALYAVTTPGAPGVFLPAGPDDRWIYGIVPGADDPPPLDLEPGALVARLRAGAGVADLDVDIEAVNRFRSPAELADRFRHGRVVLVGDAAHRFTPRGGTGLNTAVLGGHDLGWKMAWVLQGWADEALLDTYESERRVVAQHNLARSLDPDGSRRPVVDELQVDLGGRLAHAWLPASGGRTSTVDLLGPGWTLLTGPTPEAWRAAAARSRAPIVVRALDPMTARAVGIAPDGALLVRPDGVPARLWTAEAGTAALPALVGGEPAPGGRAHHPAAVRRRPALAAGIGGRS